MAAASAREMTRDVGGDGLHERHFQPHDGGSREPSSTFRACFQGGQHGWLGDIGECVGRHADAHAAQVARQRGLVVGHGLPRAGGIVRIGARDQREDAGTVARAAGEGTDVIGRKRQRHDAVTRDAGLRGLDAGHAAGRGGQAYGPAGVRAERGVGDTRGDGGPRPRRGTPGDVGRVPGVVAVAKGAIVAGGILRELRHVQSGERVSARVQQALHHSAGDVRHEVAPDGRTARAGPACLVVHVLVGQRDAVQTPDGLPRGQRGIGRRGRRPRAIAIDPDGRVHGLVHRLEAGETGLQQGGRGSLFPSDRLRGFDQAEIGEGLHSLHS